MSDQITSENAAARGTFSQYRKVATTRISDFTVPPGVPYQTPEGLRAEDEETRIAFDVHGGVYPIRESVFKASYQPARSTPVPASNVSEGLREALDGKRFDIGGYDGDEFFPAPGTGSYVLWEDIDAALAHAAPEGLRDDAIAEAWEAVQHSDIPFPHRATIRAALAHAAPEGLDVMALTEAIYAVNWLTPDPKPTRASSWRWARAEVLARKIAARLSQPDATEEAGRCSVCGHSMDVHTTVTNDGCMIEGCLCDATEEAER